MRHRFYSICPYFAMFPESFAERWIRRLTKPNEVVLDPFSGRGTTALTALLSGRRAISSDVNNVAICLTKAKTRPPKLGQLKLKLATLRRGYEPEKWLLAAEEANEFFRLAYSKRTLAQILYLRENLEWKSSDTDNMICALVLGALHGDIDSIMYLSNQMPRTISTKPRYSVKFWRQNRLVAPERDAFELVDRMATFRYESPMPTGESIVIHSDMRALPRLINSRLQFKIHCAVTSPPYLNVTNFEEDQWLRLWFLGGSDHPQKGLQSRDDRHLREDRYWEFISDMWRSLGAIMATNAHVVIRIGSRKIAPERLSRLLTGCGQLSGRKLKLISGRTSVIRRRQTPAFRPDTTGCRLELDCHFQFKD